MQEVILVKLGEIVLKGLNRRTFEDRLLKNIRRRIARAGNFEVYSMQSTIYIEPKDEDADIDEAEERISKIFGVIGYARACVCEKDMDAITKMAPEYLNDTLAGFKTFKVESKRADKKFPLGSMEISREVGAALLRANPQISVDVHNPEITVRVEIREKAAYIHGETKPGAGGEIQLTDAMRVLAQSVGMTAVDFEGKRYDLGSKLGFLYANVESALRDPELGGEFREYLKELAATL